MLRYIRYITILTVAVLVESCNSQSSPATEKKVALAADTNMKIPTIEVVRPKPRDFTATINIVGTARPNQVVQLHAMESGYVQRMYKDIGDPVKAGEIIAQLVNPEVSRQYQKQKALMEAKKSIFTRLDGIAEKTPALTTMDQVENARADYESTLAEFNATADRIGFLKVKSPFKGVVTKRFVDKGALMQSGIANPQAAPIVEVMELETIRLAVPLPESDVSAVEVGSKASIIFPELAGETFEAEVSRISRALNPKSKTMDVEIDVANPDLHIKSGMYAQVNMQVSSRENVLSVPNTALVVYQDDFFIYTVENEQVQRIPIRRGLNNKDYFEILDANIQPSTQIVVRGKNLIEPGMRVKPIQKTEE